MSSQSQEDKQMSKDQKYQKLYDILLNAFDCFKKYASKKEPNLQNIKDTYTLLKSPQENFCNINQVNKYSLILVEPLEKCTPSAMEIILLSMETILKYNLLSPDILTKMVEKLFNYINKFFTSVNKEEIEGIDFKVNSKIPKICELVYTNKNLYFHNEQLKNIIMFYLRIYLISHLSEQLSNQNKKPLQSLINKILEQISVCNITNKNYYNNSSNKIIPDLNADDHNELYKYATHDYCFVSKKYTDFLIDLIEIQSKFNNTNECDIINKYINIIQNANAHDPNSDLIKTELEKLNLEKLDIEYLNEETGKSHKIGKYGWCILCRKTANFWSNNLQFLYVIKKIIVIWIFKICYLV